MGDINTFGFELLQQLYDSNITKKEHVIILFVHWNLVKHGLRCLGSGDSRAFDGSDKGKETLPEDWNIQPNYALRYIYDSKLYILHGARSDEDLLLNLLGIENNTIASIQFPINQTVNELHGPLEVLIPSYQNLMQNVEKEFLHPIIPTTTKQESTTSTDQSNNPTDERKKSIQQWLHGVNMEGTRSDERSGGTLSSIGAADLNPLGVGGGMLFDPFGNTGRRPLQPPRPRGGGRLPPSFGRTSDGARFDPILPPPWAGRMDMPDHDHFVPPRMGPNRSTSPPPDGYDDMFL